MSIKSRSVARITLILGCIAATFSIFISCSCQPKYSSPISVKASKWTAFTNANDVNGLLIDGNDVWWATSGGVVRLHSSDGSYDKYTTIDGLVSNNVLAVAQDHKGNLWFGTDRGVMRYNGSTWQTYTTADGLADDYVSTITVDGNNNIWCGGYYHLPPISSAMPYSRGVSCYNGEEWRIFNETCLASNFVEAIAVDEKDDVWFGTDSGASRYNGESWQTFTTKDGLASDYILDVSTDQKGNAWFSTNKGVSRYDGESWYNVPTKIRSSVITVDHRGEIWLGDNERSNPSFGWLSIIEYNYSYLGVSHYNGETWHAYTTADGLASNDVRAIEEDKDGNLWFATNKGVNYYDGENWHIYVTSNEPAWDANITSIAEDLQGNIWFGSWGGGVICRKESNWSYYTIENGLADNLVSGIAVGKDGSIWFATRTGVSRYNGNDWQTYTDLGSNSIRAITADPTGNIWAGSTDGLFVYDGVIWKNISIVPASSGSGDVKKIVTDKKGIIWVDTDYNIYTHRVDTLQTEEVSDVLPSVTDMFIDKDGILWVTTVHGVKYYDGNTWHDFAMAEGETDVSVNTMLIDRDGVKWFAISGEGVSRYNGKDWQTFTTADGLSNNVVTSIYQDRAGNIWFATASGISCYRQ